MIVFDLYVDLVVLLYTQTHWNLQVGSISYEVCETLKVRSTIEGSTHVFE